MAEQTPPDKNAPRLRGQAEQRLANTPSQKPTGLDAEALLHELQVHQIELEMQNESLRQAQAELEASREHYVDLYEFAPVGYITLSRTGLIEQINLTGAVLLGEERSKLLRRRFDQLVAPEDNDRWQRQFIHVATRDDDSRLTELVMQRANGSRFNARLFCTHMHAATPQVRMALSDITEREQTSSTLRLHSEILTNLSEGILLVKDSNGVIVFSNAQIERMFGYGHEELVGKHVSILNAPGDRSAEEVASEIMIALERSGTWSGEIQNIKKDGTTFWCQAFVSGFDHPLHGRVWVSMHNDITERKRVEAQLIASKERAEEAYRVKSEFLGRMSHELRTPLNAILGFAQVMELSADDETLGAHRGGLNTILRSGWHLLRIIDDLLNLSAIEAKKVVLHYENVYVSDSVQAGIKLLSPLASERGIELTCIDDCNNLIVHADRFRLEQVLINLLSNAIKYNRDRGSVTVSCQRSAGHIRILISDTGEGIAESNLASLFKPFNRLTQRSYDIEGAGIGLSIAKQLIELMGGTIGVESVYGQGSTFWFELPAAEAQTSVQASLHIRPPSADKAMSGKQVTLLYIEDNPDHINLVSDIVSRMTNLSLLGAHTPKLGLDLARTQQPDLILLDICLPGMSGYQVLELLQSDERTRKIPVIALSATATPTEIEKGLQSGFRRYLTKPINVAEFMKAVDELLRDAVRQPG